MADYIHGSSDLREVERLERQSVFVAPWSLRQFDVAPGMKVLDLATGVGAMAQQLADRYSGIELTGLDLRASQLEHARKRHPVAKYMEGDATRMPFGSETFDRVHCTWLLEHVRSPLAVLREVHRVLKPGGMCQFVEVDNSTFSTTPEIPETIQLLKAMDDKQKASGGNPYIGRDLGALLTSAGFESVRVVPNAMIGNASDPQFFHAFVEEFAEIFESVDEALDSSMHPLITQAAAKLRGLLQTPGGEIRYTPYIGQGIRQSES